MNVLWKFNRLKEERDVSDEVAATLTLAWAVAGVRDSLDWAGRDFGAPADAAWLIRKTLKAQPGINNFDDLVIALLENEAFAASMKSDRASAAFLGIKEEIREAQWPDRS